MGLADPETALEKVREFRDLLNAENDEELEGGQTVWERLNGMRHLIEAIAQAIDPDNAERLSRENRFGGWATGDAQRETLRLIGILESQDDYEQIFGPVGPTLAANRLHPWVWDAAASLWDDGYFGKAVEDAYNKVQRQTQQSVGRLNLYGKDLYAQAFSLEDPTADMPRLRFPHLDKTEQEQSWRSAHQGAMHLGMGCAQGIRNPQAHPSDDLTEQEALEQLAALSVLARWVDECKAVGADDDAAGSS